LVPNSSVHAAIQAQFLTLLPRLHNHGQIFFRNLKCADQKQDAIQEMVALAWKWFLRLHQRGKDVTSFSMVFIFLVARAVRNGRKLCGQAKAKDVLNRATQRQHGFTVYSLLGSKRRSFANIYALVHGQQELDAYEDRLRDNTFTPPPDAAAFRLDFPQFLGDLPARDRQVAMFLSLGHSAKKAAAKFGLSQGRVTQLRQQWSREWHRWHGEEDSSPHSGRESQPPRGGGSASTR
jgi:hypothetical protein